jgi:hypothetical protein
VAALSLSVYSMKMVIQGLYNEIEIDRRMNDEK